jgi:tetratricopeptide (TPR) repeat protein
VQTIAGVEDRSITAVAADIRSDNANVSNQDYDQVIKSWNWIAKLFKIPNWYWNSLAMLKVGEARLKQTLKENPNSCEGLHNLGLNLNRQARYEEAISSFDQALEIKPDYYLSWHNRGIALYNLRKYEEATSSFDQALKIKPDYYLSWYNRGIALYNLRKYEEAISSYDQALEIKPDYDRAHDEREIACSAA